MDCNPAGFFCHAQNPSLYALLLLLHYAQRKPHYILPHTIFSFFFADQFNNPLLEFFHKLGARLNIDAAIELLQLLNAGKHYGEIFIDKY